MPGGATINRRHVSVIVENSLSLHNQTYNPAAPYSKALKEHENIFAYYPDNVTPDQIEKYLEIVSVAETLVIRDSELILCTCAASDSIKLIKHTNVNQVGYLIFIGKIVSFILIMLRQIRLRST